MELTDLTHDERLVLVALLEAIIQADRTYSEQEAAEVERISAAMGPSTYQATVAQARAELSTFDAIQARALHIERPEARELILTAVQDMAVVDEVSQEELLLVDWLAGIWGY